MVCWRWCRPGVVVRAVVVFAVRVFCRNRCLPRGLVACVEGVMLTTSLTCLFYLAKVLVACAAEGGGAAHSSLLLVLSPFLAFLCVCRLFLIVRFFHTQAVCVCYV